MGFKLRPSNFFTQNPAVNVPPASQTTAKDDMCGWVSGSPNPGWRKDDEEDEDDKEDDA